MKTRDQVFLESQQGMFKEMVKEMKQQTDQQMETMKMWVQSQMTQQTWQKPPETQQASQQWMTIPTRPSPMIPQPVGSGQENLRAY